MKENREILIGKHIRKKRIRKIHFERNKLRKKDK